MGKRIKEVTEITKDDYYRTRAAIRMLTRAREDFQSMRKRMDNRIGRKADGESQDSERLTERAFSPEDAMMFVEISDAANMQESAIEKKMLAMLRKMPVYHSFLKTCKGVGTIAAGHICGAFDIYKAETVSKMWQYSGMNPGMVVGKKRVENKDGTFSMIETTEMIRGDKLTAGFVSPFNKQLRTALCGVMADGFIKSQNEYCMKFYYPMKQRLEHSENTVLEISKAGAKPKAIMWKDAKPAHRHRAAIRYMVKMFIADLYAAWRPLHGLNVREPYNVEYLGNRRHAE